MGGGAGPLGPPGYAYARGRPRGQGCSRGLHLCVLRRKALEAFAQGRSSKKPTYCQNVKLELFLLISMQILCNNRSRIFRSCCSQVTFY